MLFQLFQTSYLYWADGGDGSGKNMRGKILMEIRDELTKNANLQSSGGFR